MQTDSAGGDRGASSGRWGLGGGADRRRCSPYRVPVESEAFSAAPTSDFASKAEHRTAPSWNLMVRLENGHGSKLMVAKARPSYSARNEIARVPTGPGIRSWPGPSDIVTNILP